MSEIEQLLSDGQRSLNLDNPKEALSFYQKVLDQKLLKIVRKESLRTTELYKTQKRDVGILVNGASAPQYFACACI